MADYTPYKLELDAAEADKALRAGLDAASTAGILMADGQGRVRAAVRGTDYGYGLVTGNGPPGNSTLAEIGQHYFDMAATKPPYEYVCVGYTAAGFVWKIYGENGAGFKVLGRFNTLAALQEAINGKLVPQPVPGDAYFIGTVTPYDVYYYDGITLSWTYYGPLGSGSGGGSSDVVGIPPHGGAGQVLKKNSAADYDIGWGDAVPAGSVGTTQLADNSITSDKVAPGGLKTSVYADNSVTFAKLAKTAKSLRFTDVRILAGAWSAADAQAEAGFPYRAAVALSGVTAEHFPQVVFSAADAISGTFSPVAESYAGGVYIYAAEAIGSAVTIPAIVATPTA